MLSQSLSGRWLQACLIFSFHLQWCCDHHGMVSWNRLKPWTNPAGPVGVVTLRNALRNSRWKLQRKRKFLDSTLGEMECMECAKIAVDLLWSWWEKVSSPSLPYMLMRNTYPIFKIWWPSWVHTPRTMGITNPRGGSCRSVPVRVDDHKAAVWQCCDSTLSLSSLHPSGWSCSDQEQPSNGEPGFGCAVPGFQSYPPGNLAWRTWRTMKNPYRTGKMQRDAERKWII